jgi:alanine racemase
VSEAAPARLSAYASVTADLVRRENASVPRSRVTIDLGALRRNVLRLIDVAAGAEVWAVVKANGYGHGAVDVARAAVDAGAAALCVATVEEAAELRAQLRAPRIVVFGPVDAGDVAAAREARLELVAATGPIPEGVPVHVKLDTGMGRWGLSELPAPSRDVVGLMSHFASAESDAAFTRVQLQRFLEATKSHTGLVRHMANSAATLTLPEARLDAVRCGIALYGISPFGDDPAQFGLEPVLRWESSLAQVKRLARGESAGYGRRFVADRETWIGIVPVGYADGFRRDMTGTAVAVDGLRCRVVGTVSMDAIAVQLPGELPVDTHVTLVGDGIRLEEHAAAAGTIAYELACGIRCPRNRCIRRVLP